LYSESGLTIDTLVEEWVNELLAGSDGAILSSIDKIKEDMKNAMLKKFQDAGVVGVNTTFDNIFGLENDISKLTSNKTVRGGKSNRRRPVKSLIREISSNIARGVANGMGQELAAVAA
jgi:hypothetical protein